MSLDRVDLVTEEPTVSRPVRSRRRPGGGTLARYLVRRAVQFVLALLVLASASFLMVHAAPGDPVRNALGIQADATVVEAKREQLGLDRPLVQQYVDYMAGVVRGDLGRSIMTDEPVRDILTRLAPATVQLVVPAFLLAFLAALVAGLVAAALTRQSRRPGVEIGFGVGTGLLSAIPEYVVGVGLVFLFGVTWAVLPVGQIGGLDSYVLPVLSLAIGPAALLSRIVRVSAAEVLETEYMRVARAKRLPVRLLYVRHALPNVLTASLTVGGIVLASMVAGSVLVESVFAWPGLGSELVSSILEKDLPVSQAMLLVFGGGVLLINLVVDVLIVTIDPASDLGKA